MNSQLHDNKTIALLSRIRGTSLPTYISIKMNIEAIAESIFAEEMEKSFLQWQAQFWYESDYRIYQIEPLMEDAISRYFKRTCRDYAGCYLVVAPDHSHAALYYPDDKKHILETRNLFNQSDVENILQTFHEWLRPVPEGFSDLVDFDAEPDNGSPANVYERSELAAMFDFDEEGE